MLLPYRVKNPVRRLPVATLGLIVINVVVYALTTDGLLEIRYDIVEAYGVALGDKPFLNFFTAAFLHADPFHLLGNMWFLWVFGPPVEERMTVGFYLGMYFAAGLAGDVLQAALGAAAPGGVQVPGIGASGCIMGVLGSYWFLFSWSPVLVFYWIGLWWHGVWEVAAFWIVGLYFVMDLLEGSMMRSMHVAGGVANFAHVGGVAAGVLICLAIRMKRDTGELSEAKALQADMKDLSLVPLHALQTMLAADPGNPEIIRAMVKPATSLNQRHVVDQAVAQAGPGLIDRDPAFVAYYITTFRGSPDIYHPVHLIRLAGIMERTGDPRMALHLYGFIVERHAATGDAETSLFRMAQCYWQSYHDWENARNCLTEMAQRFPNGPMWQFGRALWEDIRRAGGQPQPPP